MKVLQFPLARITIGFVLGLLFANYIQLPVQVVFSILILTSSVFGLLFYFGKNKNSIYFGIATYILSFFIGISNQIAHADYFQKSNYIQDSTLFEKPHLINLTIREKLKNSSYSARYIANINGVDKKNQTGKIILNIPKHSTNHKLEIGTSLLIQGTLTKNKPPNNPNQFDYSKYLENKQIYAQL